MSEATALSTDAPLFVDLDGSLIHSDSMWESLVLLAKHHPIDLLRLPLWLGRGLAQAKQRIAQRNIPDAAMLPYRADVLEFLKEQKQAGRKVYLATASDQRMARAVADHLGIFDGIVASEGTENLKGERKLAAIRRIAEDAGEGGFDYIGDSPADLPLWRAARNAYVAGQSPRLLARAGSVCTPKQVFGTTDGIRRPLVRALRPEHWVKNVLLFIPVLLAHQFHRQGLTLAALAFVAFSLCASAIYILNDLSDIESDRHHPRKRSRPFAAGALSIPFGLLTTAALLATAFGLSGALLPGKFTLMLLGYLLLTSGYSLWLKNIMLVDVMLLAILYTYRILAGGVAVDVPISIWLLAFSMFLFLSLAFVKRYTELLMVEQAAGHRAVGRNYHIGDLRIIESVGPSCGYMAVLVFALYLNEAVTHLYQRPKFLWLICPILLYWITRIWFVARRRVLTDDPLVFALRDRVSYIAGLLAIIITYFAQPK